LGALKKRAMTKDLRGENEEVKNLSKNKNKNKEKKQGNRKRQDITGGACI
jgi:hypothetical protein